MSFLRTRDRLMTQFNWSRRVATLAARLYLRVDTWEGVESTPGLGGLPLLTETEVLNIMQAFGMATAETWHVEPGETEEAATSDNGAWPDVHPKFNITGTQTGRWPCGPR
jgi:hypothetical protein